MSCDRHGAPCDPLSPVGPCSIIQWLPWSFSFLCSGFLFVDQSCSSLEGFPYSRLFLTRIPVPAHSMLPVFCSRNIFVIEAIDEDLKEIGAKKKTSSYESKMRPYKIRARTRKCTIHDIFRNIKFGNVHN